MLASDGNATYALFLYWDIRWGDDGTSIGFNAGDGERFFDLPESFTEVGVLNLELTSNLGPGNPGEWIFRIDQENVTQPPGIVWVGRSIDYLA